MVVIDFYEDCVDGWLVDGWLMKCMLFVDFWG
jgi:hypothetical protein